MYCCLVFNLKEVKKTRINFLNYLALAKNENTFTTTKKNESSLKTCFFLNIFYWTG